MNACTWAGVPISLGYPCVVIACLCAWHYSQQPLPPVLRRISGSISGASPGHLRDARKCVFIRCLLDQCRIASPGHIRDARNCVFIRCLLDQCRIASPGHTRDARKYVFLTCLLDQCRIAFGKSQMAPGRCPEMLTGTVFYWINA